MLISTTLTGCNEAIIGPALESIVDHVDACLVIDTGVRDATINVAMRVCGPKLILRRWPWRNDYGAARNAALEFAESVGADWAITVDPDERMVWGGGFDLRAYLATAPYKLIKSSSDSDPRYDKERAIRLNIGCRWIGVTHEWLRVEEHERVDLPYDSLHFTELPKSHEVALVKHARDEKMLRDYLATNPEPRAAWPRWNNYLASALQYQGKLDEALEVYQHIIELEGYTRYGYIAAWRSVQCWLAKGEPAKALEVCERHLHACPDSPDLLYFRDIVRMRVRAA